MATRCAQCPLRQLPLFDDFSADEVDFMQSFKKGEMSIGPGTAILIEGSRSPQLFTALSGLGLRYKTLRNGRRQVVNFVFPGDFIGLQAALMDEMSHSVEATTSMTLCVFNRSELWSLFKNHPERAFDLTWLAAAEEQFLGEALASIGQRSAVERIAWALVRIHARAEALSLLRNGRVHFPFRQQDLADTLGLSLVHTNKTLAGLRGQQLVSWADGQLHVMDLEGLARQAMTDLRRAPRRPLM